jgi:uncharacterized HhH-GPD family protein
VAPLFITGDVAADGLLNSDATALLIGMLLDQQVPMEWAFLGPKTLLDRLGHLDAARIAAMTEDDFVEVCTRKPAIHRFPASMGRRIRELCSVLVDDYDGDASSLWSGARDGADLYRRLRGLPGFGDEKSRIFIALLAKRFDVRPSGWESVAGVFSDPLPRTVADIDSPEALAEVRDWKRAQKTARKDKQDRPLH